MNILVLGAGSVGGYFGGRMAERGLDVSFLVRSKRQLQLEAHGLCVRSALGDIQCSVTTRRSDELSQPADLVLLTCKAYDLPSAIDAIAPAVGPHTAIVPLLNGLAHLDVLDARFGKDHVLGGTCMVDATLLPDGTIQHGGTLQRMVFGARTPGQMSHAQAFAHALAPTSLDWSNADDIEQVMWEKLVFLAALASTTCLFRANVMEIMSAPGGREAAEAALDVNADIASRAGHAPSAESLAFARRRLTDPAGPWSASMLRDLEAGGRVESDHIVGWLLAKARQHGVDAPLLSLAYTHLKAFEARRDAGRLPRA